MKRKESSSSVFPSDCILNLDLNLDWAKMESYLELSACQSLGNSEMAL